MIKHKKKYGIGMAYIMDYALWIVIRLNIKGEIQNEYRSF